MKMLPFSDICGENLDGKSAFNIFVLKIKK